MSSGRLVTDGVTELLVNIIEFTNIRQKILQQNINNMHTAGYVPQDLPIDEFSKLLEEAIDEYTQSRQFLLCDGSNIKFGGRLYVRPVSDRAAIALLEEDQNRYLESQIDKLTENSLNRRLAEELLKRKEEKDLSLQATVN
jgi:flagellar basal body rod protein FlgB